MTLAVALAMTAIGTLALGLGATLVAPVRTRTAILAARALVLAAAIFGTAALGGRTLAARLAVLRASVATLLTALAALLATFAGGTLLLRPAMALAAATLVLLAWRTAIGAAGPPDLDHRRLFRSGRHGLL